MENIVLIIDCGTQSIRAMLVSDKGEILIKEKKKYEYITKEKGSIFEFDANNFFEEIISLLLKLKSKNEKLYSKIKGVSITTQRDTFVLVDRNGTPLRNAISWLDRRKAENYKKPNVFYRLLFRIV